MIREELAYIDKLLSGVGDFLDGYGPGQELHNERWVLWCYRYQYDIRALGWGRLRTGFPEALAKPILEYVSKRWPTLPDAYERPVGSGRPIDAELGAPWPVYRAQSVKDADPIDVPS